MGAVPHRSLRRLSPLRLDPALLHLDRRLSGVAGGAAACGHVHRDGRHAVRLLPGLDEPGGVARWLPADFSYPDVILLHAGTNDRRSSAPWADTEQASASWAGERPRPVAVLARHANFI